MRAVGQRQPPSPVHQTRRPAVLECRAPLRSRMPEGAKCRAEPPDLPVTWASGRAHQSFGIRIVLLIISEPESAHSSVSGWRCPEPRRTAPNGSMSPTCSSQADAATTATRTRLEVMGVPSKYLTLSAPADSCSAVTLKRARRLTPHATKYTRMTTSHRPLIPAPYAIA